MNFFSWMPSGFLSWLSTDDLYVGIAPLVVVLAVAWWWVPKWQINRLRLTIYDPKAYADVEDNFRKTLGQLFGGVAVLLAAVFAYYQFKETLKETEASRAASQKAADASQNAARDLLVSQQTSKGFELLGSDKLSTRLGGIFALAAVMNTSREYHVPIIEALSAILREVSSNRNLTRTEVQFVLTVLQKRTTEFEKGEHKVRLNFSGADLSGVTLVGADLSGADLSGATLSNASLRASDLSGADLRDAKLLRARLASAILSGANLQGAVLSGQADLTDVKLRGAYLDSADLSDANLDRADLSGAYLPEAKLPGAYLGDAILKGTYLVGADLFGATLSGANLSRAVLFVPGLNLPKTQIAQSQLDEACGDSDTKLPSGFTIPPCEK